MARPRKCRRVSLQPQAVYFKPRGIPVPLLREVTLPLEGVEALRLVDAEGLTMAAAAASMGVSRHTLGRIIAEARAVVADALVHGKALRIDGGDFAFVDAAGAPVNPVPELANNIDQP